MVAAGGGARGAIDRGRRRRVLRGDARAARPNWGESAKWGQIAVHEATACGDQRALAEAYDVLDTVNMDTGSQTGEYWDQALEIFESLGDVQDQIRILANRGVGHQAAGRLDEAMDCYERSRSMALQIGDEYGAALLTMNEGEIDCDRGLYEQAEAHTREPLRFFRAAGDTYMVAAALTQLGRITVRTGHPDAALTMYGDAERGYEELGRHA